MSGKLFKAVRIGRFNNATSKKTHESDVNLIVKENLNRTKLLIYSFTRFFV